MCVQAIESKGSCLLAPMEAVGRGEVATTPTTPTPSRTSYPGNKAPKGNKAMHLPELKALNNSPFQNNGPLHFKRHKPTANGTLEP